MEFKRNIMITGGAGFIGSHVAQRRVPQPREAAGVFGA
ncbi:unknown [Prevotella sp. CAG:1320]|nr:unknown [Prevotella sp. CAG:1320]